MSEAAFALDPQANTNNIPHYCVDELSVTVSPISRSALFFGLSLICLQLADGLLTFLGIGRYGLSIEGNPILREFMVRFGTIPTLIVLKFAATLVIVWLVYSSREIPWVKKILGILCCVYIIAAIMPWTYILFIHPVM